MTEIYIDVGVIVAGIGGFFLGVLAALAFFKYHNRHS